MESISANQLILRYIEGWIAGNREQILSTLDPACLVIESYGPTYRGKEMVGRWIDSWFVPGNSVNSWEITSFYSADEACFFEWIFECTYAGNRNSFGEASIARLSQGKIVFLREYATTAPRYEWGG
ncbi:MAG TPA: nuclear transport factor 2 family protein [Ktedonobacteraceae bacterium]|nr:nuclear transport factor 2 family protein [Ktedonobacteraceae bacterium]